MFDEKNKKENHEVKLKYLLMYEDNSTGVYTADKNQVLLQKKTNFNTIQTIPFILDMFCKYFVCLFVDSISYFSYICD